MKPWHAYFPAACFCWRPALPQSIHTWTGRAQFKDTSTTHAQCCVALNSAMLLSSCSGCAFQSVLHICVMCLESLRGCSGRQAVVGGKQAHGTAYCMSSSVQQAHDTTVTTAGKQTRVVAGNSCHTICKKACKQSCGIRVLVLSTLTDISSNWPT